MEHKCAFKNTHHKKHIYIYIYKLMHIIYVYITWSILGALISAEQCQIVSISTEIIPNWCQLVSIRAELVLK